VPYASTYQVNFFAPWSHYEKNWGPVKNNAMPDIHTQIYPWKKFTIDTYKEGQIPLWNPYNFAGSPHLANFQSAVLSPFNLLFFILPFINAWSILILLQPLLAGLFTYFFIRAIGVSKAGSVIASIAFMFSGFIVVWMAYGTLAYAIIYLPLTLFAIERYFQTKRLWFLFLLMLTVPLSFFSGHFQISFYFLAVTLLYALFKIITARKQALLIFLPSTIFLGLILSLSQLLPSIKFYMASVRSEIFQASETIPFQYLITLVAPDFFGNATTRNDWFGHYAEWASFVGIIPVVLAIFAFTKKNAKVLFFAFLAVFSLILSIQSPLIPFLIAAKIPVISTSAQSRIIVLVSFSLAVLAGFGFDQLIRNIREVRENKKIMAIFTLVGIFFALIWLLLFFGKVYPQEWLIVAKRNLVLPTALFIGVAFFVGLSKLNKKFIIPVTCYLLLVTSFDSLRFVQKWMPFDPKALVYQEVPVVSAIKNNIGDGRIFGNIGDSILSSYYGFSSIEGYDPLYIGRYGEFIRSATTGEFLKGERSVVHLDKHAKYVDRVLDFLGVSLIFQPIADTNQGWAYPVWAYKERYENIYKDDKFELYKNTKAMPRVSLFYNYEVIKDDKLILKRFYSEDFNFRKVVLLEENPAAMPVGEGSGSAQIVSYTPNKVVISATTDSPAFLFISDNFYPGWKAKINPSTGSGQVETKIYRADYSFRAVEIPSGESKVEFIYENWYF